jgi:hypothetical protein
MSSYRLTLQKATKEEGVIEIFVDRDEGFTARITRKICDLPYSHEVLHSSEKLLDLIVESCTTDGYKMIFGTIFK